MECHRRDAVTRAVFAAYCPGVPLLVHLKWPSRCCWLVTSLQVFEDNPGRRLGGIEASGSLQSLCDTECQLTNERMSPSI